MLNTPTSSSLTISDYSGISEVIFKSIAGRSKTLTGKNASIFSKVNDAFKDVQACENLTFGEILSKLSDLLPELVKSSLSLIKKIAQSIRDFFVKENKKNNYTPAVTPDRVVEASESYVGVVNSNNAGHNLFTNGSNVAWCAATVTFICKDLYGNKLPRDFGGRSVYWMREWGIKHDIYTETSEMNRAQRNKYILENVKPGDIFVLKRRGGSHVGIITRVYEENGVVKFESAEGNWGNKFQKVTRTADDETLSGFISMQEYIDPAFDWDKWCKDYDKYLKDSMEQQTSKTIGANNLSYDGDIVVPDLAPYNFENI